MGLDHGLWPGRDKQDMTAQEFPTLRSFSIETL
jgi:hypothetical protein